MLDHLLHTLRHGRHRRVAAAGAVTLAALLGAVATCEWLEWPFLRAPLQRSLTSVLQRPVTLTAPFGVRFIGPVRLRARELVVGAAADEAAAATAGQQLPQPVLRAEDALLVIPHATLWLMARNGGLPTYIESLDVAAIDLHLRRDARGRTNWGAGQVDKPASGAQPAAPPTSQPASSTLGEEGPASSWPVFGTLRVRQGSIHYVDALVPADIRAKVRTDESGTAAPPARSVTRESSGAGTGDSLPSAAAPPPTGLRVDIEGTMRGQPVAGWLESSGFLPLLRNADDGAPGAPLRMEARAGRSRLKLEGVANDVAHLGGFSGEFDLVGPSLAAIGHVLGLTLPTTAEFAMQGRIAKEGRVWHAQIPTWSVGTSRLRAAFRYDPRQPLPLLTGTLAGARLSLADLGPAIGTAPDGSSNNARPGRVLPAREFDIPSLRQMNADVQVDLGRLDLGTAQLESFAPLQGRIVLRDGVLSLHDLIATAAAGSVRGAITVDARPAAVAAKAASAGAVGAAASAIDTARVPTAVQPRWSMDLQWSGIQLDRFVKARNPRDADVRLANAAQSPAGAASAARVNPAQRDGQTGFVSGSLGGSARVVGHGRSIAAVLGSLDGSAMVSVRDGQLSHLLIELAGLDLFEGLGVFITGDRTLPMRCAVARLALHDGQVTPEAALIDTPDTTLLVDGQLSLADESLALRVRALPHDISLFALRSPIELRGTFAAPEVRLDKKSIVRRIAGAAALALLAPPAALLALGDLGEEDRDRCQGAVQRIQQRSVQRTPPASPRR